MPSVAELPRWYAWPMKRHFALALIASSLFGCHSGLLATRAPGASAPEIVLAGTAEYDNHEQVWTAAQSAALAVPHVVLSTQAQHGEEWSIWDVRVDGATPLQARWAMRRTAGKGGASLVPYRSLIAAPAIGKDFDAAQWAALDACALHARRDGTTVTYAADPAACAVLTPGIGAMAALLPLAVTPDGEFLRVRFYVDQARGDAAREDLRRVQAYGGWVAINGAGPSAAADSTDWHMDRAMRLGSEGGRRPVRLRDGTPSGYSLLLERLTYRDGNVPVLKLSVVADADGRTLAYAWANPEATRIGLNLGWLQIGLDRATTGN